MVTTTDSSSSHHSPTSATGDSTNSPKFPRKNLPSPWAQVVRGGEPESVSAGINQSPPSSSSSSSSLTASVSDQPPLADSSPKPAPASPPMDYSNTAAADTSESNNDNAGRPRKPAWNKPSNGDVEVGSVMGAISWPSLSAASNKGLPKMSPDSSSKTVTDGSLSSSQGPATSLSLQKEATSNAKPNSGTSYTMHNRPRSMKRGGGNNIIGAGPAQSNFANPPPPPPPPPFPVFQIPPSSYGNVVSGVSDPSPRELPYRSSNWDTRPSVGGFVPPVNDHRTSSRRGNFGPHLRSDGPYHNNYGGRRDQDRGNYANTRDAHGHHGHQQRMSPRGLVRHPPPNNGAFVAPQPMAPYPNPMGFPEFYYFPTLPLEPFKNMPFFTHGPPPAMFFPVGQSPLTNMIVNQIDYYFSDANLVKDQFLRSNMDEQGWVSITLISSFPRVKSLTSDVPLILDSLRSSTVVEVQGDKVRRCNEWMKWLPSAQLRADSGSVSPAGSSHNLAADFQNITLEEATTDNDDTDPASQGFPESSSHSSLPNGDATRKAN